MMSWATYTKVCGFKLKSHYMNKTDMTNRHDKRKRTYTIVRLSYRRYVH